MTTEFVQIFERLGPFRAPMFNGACGATTVR